MLIEFNAYSNIRVVVNVSYITHIMEDKDDPKYTTIYLVDGKSLYVQECYEDVLNKILVPVFQDTEESSETTLLS